MIFRSRASTAPNLIKKALLTLAVAGLAFPSSSVAQQLSTASATSPSKSTTANVLQDGTYLFGQSATPNQLGFGYAVLSVQNNQTVGAFYQPHSSFDCFSGEVLANRLDITVVDSYEQTPYPYSVAVTVEDSLVAGIGAGSYTLEGFHRIEEISDNDYAMLETCQADFAQ